MFKRIIYLTVLIFCFSLPVSAENLPGAFTLSPMFGGHLFEGNQSLESTNIWGLGLGYNFSENWAVEGIYTRTDTDAEAEDSSTSDTKVETYHFDALYHFQPTKKLVPYVVAGIGAIYSSPEAGEDRDHFLFNYGVGIKYFILDDLIALRAEVRHLVDFPEPDNNLQYLAGLTFQLGKSAPAPAPIAIEKSEPAPAPVDLDSDGDGVMDSVDQCPDTPAGAPVDNKGCPLDSDGDGVYDYQDKCPDTLSGAQVDDKGCPLHSDHDDVADHIDKCPDTPKGVSVDADGCPTVLTLHIKFDHDSNSVGSEYDGEIAKAAQCINDYPGNIVFIDGHTDNNGPAAYNQKLSEHRAAAVKKRLVEKFNIPESRMASRGFGEDQPVTDNNSDEGRGLNRRVEVACGAK